MFNHNLFIMLRLVSQKIKDQGSKRKLYKITWINCMADLFMVFRRSGMLGGRDNGGRVGALSPNLVRYEVGVHLAFVLLVLFSVFINLVEIACILSGIVNKNAPSKPVKADIRQFVTDAEFTYKDFAKQYSSSGRGFTTLRIQDYSWEEHGYSLASQLYTEIAELLEDKFQTTQNLTYHTCGCHYYITQSGRWWI